MDFLGELLLSIRLDASSIGVFHSPGEWGLDMPRMDSSTALLYGVLDKPCWLIREGQPDLQLEVGDLVLVLGEAKVAIASQPGLPLEPFLDMWRRLKLPEDLHSRSRRSAPIHFGGDGVHRNPRLLTVACVLHEPERNQLLSSLPDVLVLPGRCGASAQWLMPTLSWMLGEDQAQKPGFMGPAALLAGFLLTSFLRDYILLIPEGQSGWLQALTDPRLGKALIAIHSQAELDWSVETLAAEASMSRATFSRRFSALLGQSPGQYLIATRMRHAARELLKGRASVADIAERYGYRSESAFRSAFKQHLGVRPREYARSREQGGG
ncbi:AraC family transcriptional regulator [Pseudomonas sp. BN411]|uniref:helix-turn-helix transcriptional regulator n=1 Tax=Pseudomonas sp. BN411 TaxID=2567887 RepID=UPI002455B7AF|nr:AraC family transcriptional regulator [Pseudomonas sp. BN411]MDH4559908.1 AraC family transcriptional regulator [Pseudomonas sp. BN411]